MKDFDYLAEGDVYLDSACQSLRPRPVIDAINRYYTATSTDPIITLRANNVDAPLF